jgi:hypothetical protein
MAQAVKRAKTGRTPFGDTGQDYGAAATAQSFYVNTYVGLNTSGHLDKGSDTQSLCFVGVVSGIEQSVPTGATAGVFKITTAQPRYVLAEFTAALTAADIGETVYLSDDQTLSLTPGVFGNVVGTVHSLGRVSTVASVELAYGGKRANLLTAASRVMAATGNQALTKWDVGKTIFVGNTAALTLSLPAVATTQAGDRMTIVKTSADAAAITIDPNASETIDGATTLATIDAAFDVATIVSTGTAWVVLNRDIA